MHRLAVVVVVVGACSGKEVDPPAGSGAEAPLGAPDYDPAQYKKYSCVDLIPEAFRATYRAVKPESDRFGHCDYRSEIAADETNCYITVTCEKTVSGADAEANFKRGTLSTAPVKLEGVGTIGFTDARKPKSLFFLVVDEAVDCYLVGILPPGSDVKALAGGTFEALAKRL